MIGPLIIIWAIILICQSLSGHMPLTRAAHCSTAIDQCVGLMKPYMRNTKSNRYLVHSLEKPSNIEIIR